jgi:hypothetical protein
LQTKVISLALQKKSANLKNQPACRPECFKQWLRQKQKNKKRNGYCDHPKSKIAHFRELLYPEGGERGIRTYISYTFIINGEYIIKM